MLDYHIHTKECGHACGEMFEYVESARSKGIKEIGFSDHIPLYFLPAEKRDPTLSMSMEQLPLYVQKVDNLRRQFPEITINLGLEADYWPGSEGELAQILKSYPFDYVYGSIHYVNGWGFDNPAYIDDYAKWDIMALYRDYFALLQKAALSGLFDILSHPDLIKKFGFRPETPWRDLMEDTIKVIKQADVAIEINTAGLRVKAQEMYPSGEFLEICHHYKIPVTLGSDAHKPDDVGRDLDKAIKLLKDVGYKEIAAFRQRRRISVSL